MRIAEQSLSTRFKLSTSATGNFSLPMGSNGYQFKRHRVAQRVKNVVSRVAAGPEVDLSSIFALLLVADWNDGRTRKRRRPVAADRTLPSTHVWRRAS